MKILVLNGSPKGKNSVTVQTALYLEKLYPTHQFTIEHVGQRIRQYEKNFSTVKEKLESSDLIIFAYPVYTFLVPYQLQRFVELMKEHGVNLSHAFATQISTSKHFYDITAHKFIEENCYDFQAKYIHGLSQDMEDLLSVKGRAQVVSYFNKLLFDMEQNIYEPLPILLDIPEPNTYQQQFANSEEDKKQPSKEKDVVVVTNVAADDEGLHNMIADFVATCTYQVRVVNIREYPFKGGCLGCFGCATTAKCVYTDGFDDYLRNTIQVADAIIYAFTIENHYTHSSLKCYDDRQFCNGHRTVTHGMPVGYLIRGNYQQEHNVRTLVEARSDVGGLYLCGVVTEQGDVGQRIQQLNQSLDYALTHQMDKPASFYGVGGTKIFRDLVYLMQGMMKADHKFYKENGIYDFPQKQRLKILQMKLIGAAISNPKIQKKMKGQMNQYIVAPYTKVIENAQG